MAALGEILQHAREQRGITLEEAERVTHIARRYLAALEAEDFSAFPAPVFGRGFLRNYSQFLGLNANDMLALWPAEGVQAAAQHDAISAEPSTRGLRFPWRGRTAQDDANGEDLPDTRPHLPRRAPVDADEVGTLAPPRRERPAWQPLREERRATIRRTVDAPSPLTLGQKPPYGTAPSRAVAGLLLWLVPLAVLLLVTLAASRAKGSGKPLTTARTNNAAVGVNVAQNTPARNAGTMPRLVGQNGQAAIQQLRGAGVEPLVITVSGGTAAPGTVTQQQPAAGSSLTTNSNVTLTVEAGGAVSPAPSSSAVPSVRPSASATVRATPRVP
jgi:transcriptional regulator with XRE-family HTH domain